MAEQNQSSLSFSITSSARNQRITLQYSIFSTLLYFIWLLVGSVFVRDYTRLLCVFLEFGFICAILCVFISEIVYFAGMAWLFLLSLWNKVSAFVAIS